MRPLRIASWIAVALVVAAIAVFLLSQGGQRSFLQMAGGGFDGPFALVATDGRPVSEKDLLGKPHLVFFGFTNCPEVCPTTLFEMSGWMAKLGDEADRLSAWFITVDPERDDVETLASYVSPFDKRITALTGTPGEVARAAAAFHVYFKKESLEDGDYTMDHTASVFLIMADGSFAGTISYNESEEIALEKLRRLIKNG